MHKNNLSAERTSELIEILAERFTSNMHRHKDLDWQQILVKLQQHPEKLWSLDQMEISGGEPDVIRCDQDSHTYLFIDCSPESPMRRSLCYDHQAWESRKANKPSGNAVDMASVMGVEILSEQQYRELQLLGKFDRKTSSWIKTPDSVRNLGGALFCDFRYDMVFTYHNGADSYYAARGFRGCLEI
ncbi:DUF4256 domain-containing protein [Chryseobacterium camelliae]|uniref:DUF4256 domain-containing protein n=1 Tax=Chryseobacterium camelliae TaxID=1265445 RepID=UPI00285B86A6|nr:DUF4256 domain-containing protein [Chryseobacterium camelliae]MDR6515508.1 hypothetical protein [Chryseobacterium camelliae]